MNRLSAQGKLGELRLQARIYQRSGEFAKAEANFKLILDENPQDIEALNQIAIRKLQRDEHESGIELLSRAAQLDPRDEVTQANLGRACQIVGELTAASEAFRAVLSVNKENHEIRLRLGEVLEAAGERLQALRQYFLAISSAQSAGQWISPASVPVHLHVPLGRAMRYVAGFQRQLLEISLAPIESIFGVSALVRVRKCMAGYLKEITVGPSDPRQRPKFLFFPDLPATPYFRNEQFDWIDGLEASAGIIRQELHKILEARREPFLTLSERANPADFLTGGDSPEWSAHFFYRHGLAYESNRADCPYTAAVVDALPLVRISGNAPEVLFSFLGPNSHIMPHTGVTNTRVVAHLPLIVPDNCALSVAGQPHIWADGRCVVFDDTFEHEAWNHSEHMRVVLLLDVWNPYLTEAEQAAVAALVPATEVYKSAIAS